MGTDPLLGKSWRLGISPWRIGFCWDLQRFKICSEPSCWVGWFKPAYPAISAIGPQNQSKPVKANWPVTGYWKRAAWVAALNPNDAHVRAQPHQLPFPIGIIPAREHWPWSHKQPRPDLWSKSTSCPCRVPSLDVKNPWILGLDEAETLCFYMCLHLCKHESRLKRGRKKCKNRYEGDPEYLPFIHFWEWSVCSQLSGQSMNVCVCMFLVWWSWTLLWSTKADTAGGHIRNHKFHQKNDLWINYDTFGAIYFWTKPLVVASQFLLPLFLLLSSTKPSLRRIVSKACITEWYLMADAWQNVWGNVGDTTNLWTCWSYW